LNIIGTGENILVATHLQSGQRTSLSSLKLLRSSNLVEHSEHSYSYNGNLITSRKLRKDLAIRGIDC
jgi:hypothetical protein